MHRSLDTRTASPAHGNGVRATGSRRRSRTTFALPLGICDVLVSSIGTEQFAKTLHAVTDSLVGVDELFAYTMADDGVPRVLASSGRGDARQRVTQYAERYYRHDLLLDRARTEPHVVKAHQISAETITPLDYRHICFETPGFREKWSFTVRSTTSLLIFSVYRKRDRPHQGIDALCPFAELALMALDRQRAWQAPDEAEAPLRRIERKLAERYEELTERERAVCPRTLIGMTAEAIALDLDIRSSTVLTYRRRAYERYRYSNANQFLMRIL